MTSPRLITDQKQAIPVDLKPCPFCGAAGEDLLIFCDPEETSDNSGPSRRIQCAACFVEAPFYETEGDAVAAWNRRHDLPTSPDLQAEAERVFADVQREVLVEDAKAVIAKALQAVVDAERERCAKIAEPPLMHRVGNHGLWRVRRAQIAADIRAQGS